MTVLIAVCVASVLIILQRLSELRSRLTTIDETPRRVAIDHLLGWLAPITSPLLGKINDSEFEGKHTGTLLFMGQKASSDSPAGRLIFVYRPEGWNKMFRADTQTWEEVVHVGTGKGLYEAADFSPLAGLKASHLTLRVEGHARHASHRQPRNSR